MNVHVLVMGLQILMSKAGPRAVRVNSSSPHDALKLHFTFLKTDLIFLQQKRALERTFP